MGLINCMLSPRLGPYNDLSKQQMTPHEETEVLEFWPVNLILVRSSPWI